MPGANIAAVATEAGVSRPTVYRYFADHQALVDATLLHAGRDLTERLGAQLRRLADAGGDGRRGGALRAPGDPARARARRDVERRRCSTPARWPASPGARRSIGAGTRVKDLVRAAGWSAEAADEAVEVMLRMLLSLLAAPEPRRSDAALRAFLMRRLVPALGLATPGRRPSR